MKIKYKKYIYNISMLQRLFDKLLLYYFFIIIIIIYIYILNINVNENLYTILNNVYKFLVLIYIIISYNYLIYILYIYK